MQLHTSDGVQLCARHWDPGLRGAGRIAPTPLLVVHGEADHYFPLPHVELLRDPAPEATGWIEPGMKHAESATSLALIERIVDWVRAAIAARVSAS